MFKSIEELPNKFNDSCYLYWIRLESHHDILTQGYVGFTKDYTSRIKSHQSAYNHYKRKGSTHHPVLHQAADKYDCELVVDLIYVGDRDSALQMEELLRPHTYIGWNINRGGDYGWVGREHTKESLEKMRQSKLGLKQTPETVRRRMESRSGYSPSQETREKAGKAISDWYAQQTSQRRSEIAKKSARRRIENGNHVPTEEHRKKVSASLKGRVISKETIDQTNATKQEKREKDLVSCVVNHGKHRYLYEVLGEYILTSEEGADILGLKSPQSFRARCMSIKHEDCRVIPKDTEEYKQALDFLYEKHSGEA